MVSLPHAILNFCLFHLYRYLMLHPKFNLKGEESCCFCLFAVIKRTRMTLEKMMHYCSWCDTDVTLKLHCPLWTCSVSLPLTVSLFLQRVCEALVCKGNSGGCLDSEHFRRKKLLRDCPWGQLHHRQLGGRLWLSLLDLRQPEQATHRPEQALIWAGLNSPSRGRVHWCGRDC